jgi:hypothetical protein
VILALLSSVDPIWSLPVPHFSILKSLEDGSLCRVEEAETLESAKERVEQDFFRKMAGGGDVCRKTNLGAAPAPAAA